MKEVEEHKKAFFSIIVPTFNRAVFLPQTIKSVINQEFGDWECIVIDDGSTDNTKEVINSFKDSRIKYFYKKNEERSIARNYGIEKAKGQYICFLDSDDIYYHNHLKSLKEKIQEKNFPIGMFYTGINEKRGDKITPRPTYNPQDYSHPVYFVWEKFMLINSICMHYQILKEHKFPEEFNVWEDTHLWLRITASYPFFQLKKVTAQWNRHNEGSVTKSFNKVKYENVKKYLHCISNLFQIYNNLMEPFFDCNDFKLYKTKKLKMFMRMCILNGQPLTFIKLYVYGLKNLKPKDIHEYACSLVIQKIKKKSGFRS